MNARQRTRLAFWLLAPALTFVVVLGAFPVLSQIALSFTKFNLKFADERGFAGLSNFAQLISDGVFWQDLGHTAYFTVVSVGLELILGLAAALALNRIGRGRTAMNTSIVLPWALPTVVAATMWSLILNDRMGLLNSVLVKLGAIDTPVVWLGPGLAMGSIILADVWKTTPFVAIILLAGLKSIPDQYYEAASLDGAGKWHQFRFVTMPLLRPFIAIALLESDAQTRCVAIRALARTGDPRATETALQILNYRGQPPQNVRPPVALCRGDAAEALGTLSEHGQVPEQQRPAVLKALRDRLRLDTDRHVRIAAARGLAYCPEPAAVEALIDGLRDADFAVVHQCEESLVRLTGYTHDCSVLAWEQWLAAHRDDLFANAGRIPESRQPPYHTRWGKFSYESKEFFRWLWPGRKEE